VSTKSITIVTRVGLIIMVAVVVFYIVSTNSLYSDRVVKGQEIKCLVAICVTDSKFGDSCFEMSRNLKLVTEVERKDGTSRIIIEPSTKECKSK